MIRADYIVIGSGMTGATIARLLADAGRDVCVVECRENVGGNVHDQLHQPSGLRFHTYGPHYFRTSSDRIWEFVNRFSEFTRYEASVMSRVEGQLEHWPIHEEYIRRTVGRNWQPEFTGTPANLEEAALSLMPRVVYEKFVNPYNEKQWGMPCDRLNASLCRRFDVRPDHVSALTPDRTHQGIPTGGYSALMARMLDGVDCTIGADYMLMRGDVEARKCLIYTGPIDRYFGYSLGKLAYRGQRREHRYMPSVTSHQECAQVNTPQHVDGPSIRSIEWRKIVPTHGLSVGTLVTTETPYSPVGMDALEYPVPDEHNAFTYGMYRSMANHLDNVVICGRLGEYRYYDMDQAIERAMTIAKRIIKEQSRAKTR
jgi:UDP-galactopyranose mutase